MLSGIITKLHLSEVQNASVNLNGKKKSATKPELHSNPFKTPLLPYKGSRHWLFASEAPVADRRTDELSFHQCIFMTNIYVTRAPCSTRSICCALEEEEEKKNNLHNFCTIGVRPFSDSEGPRGHLHIHSFPQLSFRDCNLMTPHNMRSMENSSHFLFASFICDHDEWGFFIHICRFAGYYRRPVVIYRLWNDQTALFFAAVVVVV